MSTIPASDIVSVNPSVLAAGGLGVEVIGLFLTESTRAPTGEVLSFSNAAAVDDYFGPESDEARMAGGATNYGSGYFGGFNGSNRKPASILFAQYNPAAVAAWLRGSDISSLSLAALQAITGTLIVTVDGSVRTAGSLNLSAATSFSSGATIIQTALNASKPTIASFTAAIAGTALTVSAVASGSLGVGQIVLGSGVDPGLYIIAQVSGTAGGIGVYTLSGSDTVSSTAMTTVGRDVAVSFDSLSGGYVITSANTGAVSTIGFASGTTAASLKLTSATGAVNSQGAAAASPDAFMSALVEQNRNWVTFTTIFDPDDADEWSVKEDFAAWCSAQNNRFCYVCWDLNQAPVASSPAAGCLSANLAAAQNSGTVLLNGMDAAGWGVEAGSSLAAFFMGAAASIDFTQRNGRISFSAKAQDGLLATTTTGAAATNLGGNPQVPDSPGNGYNFYGAYGAANANFVWFQRGFVTGDFVWADAYINQIWMNSLFQSALLALQANSRSIPYSVPGYALIETALADAIQQALNFGAFGPSALSSAQKAAVNNAAGVNIADTLETVGYYLQVLPATAQIRAARTSPACTFWYVDQGSIQAINLASVALI